LKKQHKDPNGECSDVTATTVPREESAEGAIVAGGSIAEGASRDGDIRQEGNCFAGRRQTNYMTPMNAGYPIK